MSEQELKFEEAKLEAIKEISEMSDGDEAILYLDNGDGYTEIRIGMSDGTKALIITHEGVRILEERNEDDE